MILLGNFLRGNLKGNFPFALPQFPPETHFFGIIAFLIKIFFIFYVNGKMNFSAEVMFFECFPANGAHPGGASNLRFCVYLQFFLQFFCVLFFFCVVFYKGPRYICLDPQ